MHADDKVLVRVAAGRDGDGQPFLLPHHMMAAARLERLIERACLAPRLTMSYDPARVSGGDRAGKGAADASDAASDARRKLNQLADAIPADCWGVMFDVCGLGMGLQAVETSRRWPRRSAKLVLRIGLEHLALLLGLTAQATGKEQGRVQAWLPNRLPIVPDIQP
jgi:hypothetical protein